MQLLLYPEPVLYIKCVESWDGLICTLLKPGWNLEQVSGKKLEYVEHPLGVTRYIHCAI